MNLTTAGTNSVSMFRSSTASSIKWTMDNNHRKQLTSHFSFYQELPIKATNGSRQQSTITPGLLYNNRFLHVSHFLADRQGSSHLTFTCPCIASISLKYNQQDATFSRSVYFHKLLYLVSGGSSAHHQEHKNVHTASGIVKPILLPAAIVDEMEHKFHLIHDSSRQQYCFDNTWRCMYSFVLLMMGGGTAWNM